MRTNCSHTVPSTSPVESSARGRRFVGLGAAARTLLGTAALAFALSSPASATPPTPDLDFTAGPQDPEISVGDVSHLEGTGGDTVFVFTVELSFASDEIVTAKVLGVDGTAEEGPDFDGPAVNLIYAPGETSKSYEVSVVGDSDVEGDEVFAVMVEQIDGAEIGDTEAVGTIVDDDVDPGGADPGAEAPADPGLPPTTDDSKTNPEPASSGSMV